MTPRQDLTDKAQSLLPPNKKADRPLFMVLVILAFLATLTLLAVASGQRAAAGWQSSLGNTVTVQIKPGENRDDAQRQAKQAETLLQDNPAIASIDILTPQQSKALLRPWLGDAPLPDDLPLPILLDVRLKTGQTLDIQHVTARLSAAGLRADIDDHNQWSREIKQTTRAAQLLSLLALSLIIIASVAASIFATRAGLTGQRRLMDVLHQVGAAPGYTARLLSARYGMSGFKAGAVGALAALLVSILVGLVFSTTHGFSYFLPGLQLSLTDMYLVLAVPVFLAIIISVTCWHTVIKTLYDEIYP